VDVIDGYIGCSWPHPGHHGLRVLRATTTTFSPYYAVPVVSGSPSLLRARIQVGPVLAKSSM
jgi:hypothetical protein